MPRPAKRHQEPPRAAKSAPRLGICSRGLGGQSAPMVLAGWSHACPEMPSPPSLPSFAQAPRMPSLPSLPRPHADPRSPFLPCSLVLVQIESPRPIWLQPAIAPNPSLFACQARQASTHISVVFCQHMMTAHAKKRRCMDQPSEPSQSEQPQQPNATRFDPTRPRPQHNLQTLWSAVCFCQARPPADNLMQRCQVSHASQEITLRAPSAWRPGSSSRAANTISLGPTQPLSLGTIHLGARVRGGARGAKTQDTRSTRCKSSAGRTDNTWLGCLPSVHPDRPFLFSCLRFVYPSWPLPNKATLRSPSGTEYP